MGKRAAAVDLPVKKVGLTGQISLGVDAAGRHVTIDRLSEHSWLVVEVDITPKSAEIAEARRGWEEYQRTGEFSTHEEVTEWLERMARGEGAIQAPIDRASRKSGGQGTRKKTSHKS